jgi:LysM repeat protein
LYVYNNISEDSLLTAGQTLILGYDTFADGSTALRGFAQARVQQDGTIMHVVESGDSLIGIAEIYGLTLEELFALSGLNNDSVLQLGQRITVGTRPEPQSAGGSTDLPAPLASPTLPATATATALPLLTETPVPAMPTEMVANTAVPTATQLAASSTPAAEPSAAPQTPSLLFSSIILIISALIFIGVVFLYLGRR